MKFQAAVLATVFAVAQAQFTINLPKAGSTIQPGKDLTVQLFVPIDTSAEAGQVEISLAIGIVNCGSAACPDPSKDLGELVFVGKYVSQGQAPTQNLNTFGNFSVTVPSDISGTASIQVQRVSVVTPPGHSLPAVEYISSQVTTSGGGSGSGNINVHPNGDNSKCVGILGGTYANGTPVDIFDCNASATQKWQWNGNSLQSTNPADGSKWCLDSGVQSTWADGLKQKIWQCLPNLPQQTWTPVNPGSSGNIKLTAANFCLDLTNGDKTNQNVLQIWTCGGGNTNQIWSVTSV